MQTVAVLWVSAAGCNESLHPLIIRYICFNFLSIPKFSNFKHLIVDQPLHNVPSLIRPSDLGSWVDRFASHMLSLFAELEWASVNLGIVICIKCSGVHRGLGVHVSKVKSLNLDKWDRAMVEFMQSQGNTKSNSYYESTLGDCLFSEDIKKPTPNASK